MTIVATKHKTASGGTAIESSDGKSGAVVSGDGSAFTWGDDGALLLAELDKPEGAVHLSDSGAAPSVPNHAADVADARERIYGRDRTPEDRASTSEARRALGARKGYTAGTEREAEEVRAFLATPAGQRTPSRTPWESDGAEGSADGSDDVADMLRADPELARVHKRLSDSQAPLHTPEPLKRDDSRQRDAADPIVAGAGSGRRTTLPHEQALPMLAPQSIAQLRGFANSDDPAERAKVKRAVSALPALAQALGQDLLRKLRDA